MPRIQTCFAFVAFLLATSFSFAQTESEGETVVFAPDDLFDMVIRYHPVAKQAALIAEEAVAELRIARGNFDPKLKGALESKQFKGQQYYRYFKPELTVPTLPGIDLRGGFERNEGIYLNPENQTAGGQGLAYAGLTIPIGRGLFMDYRRAALQQADIFQDIADADRRKVLNKLMITIAKDYWQWYFHYHQYRFLLEGYQLAEFRYRAVKHEVAVGSLAPIDSTEALINLQIREVDLQNATNNLSNARIILSNHIWGADNQPLEMEPYLVPIGFEEWLLKTDIETGDLADYFAFAEANHPELNSIDGKLGQLLVERRLARENLKPVIDFNYNFLSTNIGQENINGAFLSENYKMGLYVEMPLFLRKERGKIQQVRIKTDRFNQERDQLRREIMNEIAELYNDFSTMRLNLQLHRNMVTNARRMLDGERQKFRMGLSSVFLVNLRESSLLDAQVKLYHLHMKMAGTLAELRYAAGMGI